MSSWCCHSQVKTPQASPAEAYREASAAGARLFLHLFPAWPQCSSKKQKCTREVALSHRLVSGRCMKRLGRTVGRACMAATGLCAAQPEESGWAMEQALALPNQRNWVWRYPGQIKTASFPPTPSHTPWRHRAVLPGAQNSLVISLLLPALGLSGNLIKARTHTSTLGENHWDKRRQHSLGSQSGPHQIQNIFEGFSDSDTVGNH